MTTKRTHGPCSCYPPPAGGFKHEASCPSLYSAQQEPDALTRLARLIRTTVTLNAASEEQALTLISEAREEQRKAVDDALARAESMVRDMSRELYRTAHSDTLVGGAAGMVDAANAIARMRTK